MKFLTRREELILLSIGNLGEDAYLVSIREHLSDVMKNYIEAYFGQATSVRGGRRKKIYRLTRKGMEALKDYKKVNDVLWRKFADFEFSK